MESVNVYSPNSTASLSTLKARQLLQLSRPTHHCKFVRQGDIVHLLVYLNGDYQLPFLRVPISSLHRAAKGFIEYEKAIS